MTTVRLFKRGITSSAAVCLAVAAFGLNPSAYAAKPKAGIKLQVSPARPTTNHPLTVVFRNDGSLKHTHQYVVVVRDACANDVRAAVDGVTRRGWVSRVTLPVPSIERAWCIGRATVSIRDTGYPSTALFQTAFTIRSSSNPAQLGTPVRINVIRGSTITVRVPGRDPRFLPLAGGFRGFIPGGFALNSDFAVTLLSGSLNLDAFTPDALCTGPALPVAFALAAPPTSSAAQFPRSGDVTMTLSLNADPVGLAGCAGPAAGDTTLHFTGALGTRKLAELQLVARVDGIPVAAGVTASASVDLHLQVEILDHEH